MCQLKRIKEKSSNQSSSESSRGEDWDGWPCRLVFEGRPKTWWVWFRIPTRKGRKWLWRQKDWRMLKFLGGGDPGIVMSICSYFCVRILECRVLLIFVLRCWDVEFLLFLYSNIRMLNSCIPDLVLYLIYLVTCLAWRFFVPYLEIFYNKVIWVLTPLSFFLML